MEQERPELKLSPEEYISSQWEQVVLPHVDEELRPLAQEILQLTIDDYSESHRKYHVLLHIADCLQKLEPYKDREDYLQLWLALFWHDDVYDTHATDNEEQSGMRAQDRMIVLRLPGKDTVNRLIVSTKSHLPEQEDEALICSIDMSILAESSDVYLGYAAAIREEYEWVPLEIFLKKRVEILENFGKPFYHPDFEHLNPVAKRNIDQEIEQLKLSNH